MLLDPSNPEFQELQAETQSLVALAGTYAVTTADEYSASAADLKRIKGALAHLDTLRKKVTKPIDAAKRAVMEMFREPEEKLTRAEAGVKRAMIAFSDEQARLQREAQAKLDDQARRERLRLESLATKAADSGKVEKAAAFEQRAAMVTAPVIARETPKIAGVSTREAWKFEVTNPDLVPREFLTVDEAKIRRYVGAMKADAKIAGVRVYSERVLASSAA